MAAEQAEAAKSCEGSSMASAMTTAHDLAVAAMFLVVASWSLVRGSERQAPKAEMAAALTSFTEVLIWRVNVAGKVLSGAIRERSLWGGMLGRTSKAATWTCSQSVQSSPAGKGCVVSHYDEPRCHPVDPL